MSWLDPILLLAPIGLLIRGIQRGFFKQIFSLGAMLIAGLAGFYAQREFVIELWESDEAEYFKANLILMILIIAGVFLLILYLGRLLTGLFKQLQLDFINRFAGAILGALKGILISCLTVFIIQAISLQVPEWGIDWRQNSYLLPWFQDLNAILLQWFLGDESPEMRIPKVWVVGL